jgi:hypothetical protein
MRHYVEVERVYWERYVLKLDGVFDTDEEALEHAKQNRGGHMFDVESMVVEEKYKIIDRDSYVPNNHPSWHQIYVMPVEEKKI